MNETSVDGIKVRTDLTSCHLSIGAVFWLIGWLVFPIFACSVRAHPCALEIDGNCSLCVLAIFYKHDASTNDIGAASSGQQIVRAKETDVFQEYGVALSFSLCFCLSAFFCLLLPSCLATLFRPRLRWIRQHSQLLLKFFRKSSLPTAGEGVGFGRCTSPPESTAGFARFPCFCSSSAWRGAFPASERRFGSRRSSC